MSPVPATLTVAEFAHETRLCRASVYNLISRGEVRAVKIGRATRIPASELQRLLGESEVPNEAA